MPGYKRRDVRFEELLREARRGDQTSSPPGPRSRSIAPRRPDRRHNVNLELETTKARENRLMFELYASIFQSRMELIQSAITSSR